ncbi:integrin beta-like protein 1 [Lates japonicus]|uniref:Integrin beta-like protein 1 n=1 Tax=Lates japonicus TaxID=270547 RepID=A0AAD3MD09_LATJO|nr:integrin beta-like protein 1 [Lates japonicus]
MFKAGIFYRHLPCGSCMCDNEENRGLVTGRFCECDDNECLDEDTERCVEAMANGKICSNRGTCVCGECNCYDVDPSGDWGDIHGDTCECDERNCHATYDRYTDDFCSGHGQCNCGRCDCKEGWAGKKCEHPLSCSLSLESSLKKCRGTSNLPCFGRGTWSSHLIQLPWLPQQTCTLLSPLGIK